MKRMRFKLCARLSGVLLLAAFVTPVLAFGEEPEPSRARVLFLEGRKLASAGDFKAACPKFEESLHLEVGIGTQFNLADCWEHVGRTASAHALFLGAAASAKAVGQTDREQVLRERATALEPRLSRLVVEVAATDPKLSVKRGELPLGSEVWGKAVAVDPGAYVIVAKAPGKKTWEKRLELTPGTSLVTVEVPALEPEAKKKAAPAVKPTLRKDEAETPPVERAAAASSGNDRDRHPNYAALALGAVGVGGIATGTLMGLQYKSANDDAKAICPTSRDCTRKQIDDHDRLVDSASTARTWSYAGFGVGAAALVGAGVLWYFKIPKARAKTSLQAAPVLTADGNVGATLVGSF